MSNNLHKQIEEQQKIIQYLQEKYKNDTGTDAPLPQTWTKFLGVDESKAPIQELQLPTLIRDEYSLEKKPEFESFLLALSALNLPQKKVDTKRKSGGMMMNTQGNMSNTRGGGNDERAKKQITTTFNPANSYHMVEKIDLSNYVGKKFSRAAMRELVESIADMRCLNCIVLQNNGIDDTYLEEIDELFSNTRLTSIDLSRNNIGKITAIHIGKLMKDKITHIEWLDISRNSFSEDHTAINTLMTGLKRQKDLFHLAIDINCHDAKQLDTFNLTELPARLLQVSPNIQSMALIDSKITHGAMDIVNKVLHNSQHHLIALSFKYCFLDTKCMYMLSRSIEANRTLVKLDLSSNGLAPICGIYIAKSLKENINLMDLDLSRNLLNDDFALELAKTLAFNQILWRVDISNNPIGEKGAIALLKSIKEHNDTIESLGNNLEQNSAQMGVINVEELRKSLKQNKVSKEIRSKLLYQQRNPSGDDPINITITQLNYENSQQFFDSELDDYKLAKPILFTNELLPDTVNVKLWNI